MPSKFTPPVKGGAKLPLPGVRGKSGFDPKSVQSLAKAKPGKPSGGRPKLFPGKTGGR